MTTNDTRAETPAGSATADGPTGSGPAVGEAAGSGVVGAGGAWCDRCGEPAGAAGHEVCRAARALEPPRFCGHCRRRMKVQVLPTGWRATCVEHGAIEG